MKTVLITGISGYIGSHIALLFSQRDFFVVGIDLIINPALTKIPTIRLFQGDCSDTKLVETIFKAYEFLTVIHCASLVEVGESVVRPELYYQNNLSSTLTILNAMKKFGTKYIVFSSSCAVYGTPEYLPLDENHPIKPISPYGKTKQIIELMLQDFESAYGIKSVSLRFFNAAGAWHQFNLGENHHPETHLLPRLIRAALSKKPIEIYGNNYPTHDGTCIRDFVSVGDIALANLISSIYLEMGGTSKIMNLGSGRGYSILQIITELELQLNTKITIINKSPRPGDPSILIANNSYIKAVVHWTPTEPLPIILQQAISWELKKTKLLVN
jgi:UDP-glucose 4-epimerase